MLRDEKHYYLHLVTHNRQYLLLQLNSGTTPYITSAVKQLHWLPINLRIRCLNSVLWCIISSHSLHGRVQQDVREHILMYVGIREQARGFPVHGYIKFQHISLIYVRGYMEHGYSST